MGRLLSGSISGGRLLLVLALLCGWCIPLNQSSQSTDHQPTTHHSAAAAASTSMESSLHGRRLDLIWDYHRSAAKRKKQSRGGEAAFTTSALRGSVGYDVSPTYTSFQTPPATTGEAAAAEGGGGPSSSTPLDEWRKGRFFHKESDETLALRDPMYSSFFPDKADDLLYSIMNRHALERGFQLRKYSELRGSRDLTRKTLFDSAYVIDRGSEMDGYTPIQMKTKRASRTRTPVVTTTTPSSSALLPSHISLPPTASLCPLGHRCVDGLGIAHVVIVRDPIEFAIQTFYYLSQRSNTRLTRNCPSSKAFLSEVLYRAPPAEPLTPLERLQAEAPYNLTLEHYIHAKVFATKRLPPDRKNDPCLTFYLSRYEPQYSLIALDRDGTGLDKATQHLRRYRFLVGTEQHLPELFVLLSNRLGWSIRDVLVTPKQFQRFVDPMASIPDVNTGGSSASAAKPAARTPWRERWPADLVEVLSSSRLIRQDYDFLKQAEKIQQEQWLAFGKQRLRRGVSRYTSMQKHLALGCTGKLAPEVYAKSVAMSTSKSQGERSSMAKLDELFGTLDRAISSSLGCEGLSAAQEVICENTDPGLRCMLRLHDECKAGMAPEGFCFYE